MTINRNPCPVCGGMPLPTSALLYQHRTHCRIYAADTATINADHERRSGVREPTNAERELIHHETYLAPDADHLRLGIKFNHRTGIHRRTVVYIDAHGRAVADAERGADHE